MPIRQLPPPPTRDDPVNFAIKGDAFVAALPDFVDDANALEQSLQLVATTGTSTSTLTVGTGSKSLTTQEGKAWVTGAWVYVFAAAAVSNYMVGQVTSYDTVTGALVVNVSAIDGSGSHSSWIIGLATPVADGHLVPRDGTRAMTGALTLVGDAVSALEAVPKQQLDAAVAAIAGRNRIINGTFAINQRAFAGGALTFGVYGHDRWKAGAGGATYTVSGEAATITAGTLQQVIEGVNVPEGGAYTLSWTGTAQARVDGGAYAASPITVTGKTAGANTTVEFSAGTVSRVQYEAGGAATAFERRLFSVELAACLRYYEVSGHSSYYSGSVQSGGAYYATSSFKATKRIAAPTVVTTNGGATGFDASNPTVSSSSADGFTVTKGANATNAGGFYIYTWTASAEL